MQSPDGIKSKDGVLLKNEGLAGMTKKEAEALHRTLHMVTVEAALKHFFILFMDFPFKKFGFDEATKAPKPVLQEIMATNARGRLQMVTDGKFASHEDKIA